ncbi:MAG TPA: serine hydrolase, partial [Actinopolymorphaceae bacterium]
MIPHVGNVVRRPGLVCLPIVAGLTSATLACQAPDQGPRSHPAEGRSATPSPSAVPPRVSDAGRSPGPTVADRRAAHRALGAALREAVDGTDFGEVRGRSPMPNLDTAVIRLDEEGRPVAAANVLLSKDYPHGAVVPVDDDLGTTAVRWRRWTGDQWGAGKRVDITEPPESAELDFTAPYPASILKLLVAFGVLRLVDDGAISLDDRHTYRPSRGSGICGSGGRTRTVRAWLDRMITVSDNQSTCALLMVLDREGGIEATNETFAELGLTTLRIAGVERSTGRDWRAISMTALDTARLLLVVSGAPGELWRTPAGEPVTADVLSPSSRELFVALLADQGLNQMLSTVNWCGRTYPAQGIPQRVPDRWIGDDGTVTVGSRNYEQDVRPCNAGSVPTPCPSGPPNALGSCCWPPTASPIARLPHGGHERAHRRPVAPPLRGRRPGRPA